jgi:dTDP-glucose pyrophosphorylase
MEIGEKSILELAIESLSCSNIPVEHYVFVVLDKHLPLAKKLISKCDLHSFEIVPVAETPDGQARSVEIGLRKTGILGDFLVWNGDTYLRPGWDDSLKPGGDWMLLSKLSGDHWSFAEVEDFKVRRTAEKVRISEFASLGLYGFGSSTLFVRALEEQSGSGESYVAPLYNFMIEMGLTVQAHVIENSFMVPLGTPAEVYSSCLANGWTLPREMKSWSQEN